MARNRCGIANYYLYRVLIFPFFRFILCNPGVFSWKFLVGVCRPVLQILTLLRTKKCHFSHTFSGLASKKLSSLLRLEQQPKKIYSNPLRIRIFLFLSYSFGIETINTFIHSRTVPSKTIPNSRQKWVKCIPVFRPKRRKNPTRWGGTCLYSLYKRVPPGSNVSHAGTSDVLDL